MFSPLNLFSNGEPGGWYDPSDLTTMFQDAAGTTAAALESPVGLVLDKSKGLVLGSELVTNGTFDSDTTGWTASSSSLSVSSGFLRVTNVGANFGAAFQSVTTVVGKTYKLTFTVGAQTNTSSAWIGSSAGGTQYRDFDSIASGTYSLIFTATSTTLSLRFLNRQNVDGNYSDFDNISVRELPGNHLSQSTSTARPVLSARVNLLTYTSTPSNAIWGTSVGGTGAITRTDNYAIAPDGTQTATRIQMSYSGENAANFAQFRNNTNPNVSGCTGTIYLKSTDGTNQSVVLVSGAGTQSSPITVTNSWQQFTVTDTGLWSYGPTVRVRGASGAAASADILVWGADVRSSTAGVGLPAYQRVGAATSGSSSSAGTADYDATGFPYYLKFDGTDDFLVSGTISPGSVDKAQVFAGVRRLPSATDYPTICEYSAEFDGAGNSGTFYLGFGSATQNAYGMGLKGSSHITYNPITYTPPITNVASMLMDIGGSSKADELKPYLNGVLEQEGGAGTNAGTGNFGSYPLYVGRRGGSVLPFSGHLYSLILRFSATNMDAATIAATETWVNQRTKAY